MTIVDFNLVIIENIFRYLPIKDQFSCQKVCKIFNTYFTDKAFRQELKIDETWKSHHVCEFLIDQIIPPEKIKEMHRVCIRNGQIVVWGRTGFFSIGNAGLIIESIARGINDISNFRAIPVSERLKEMHRVNEEIRAGKHDYDLPEIDPGRPSEYKCLNDYDDHRITTITVNKFFTLAFKVAVQVVIICKHVDSTKKRWERAPEEINHKVWVNLTYPEELKQDPVLGQYVCQKSGHIPLIPIIDKCGHFFDYVFIKDHLSKEVKCPIKCKELLLISDLTFDRKAFLEIQTRLKHLKSIDSPLVKGKKMYIFTFSPSETNFS